MEGGCACLQRVRPFQAQLVVSFPEAGNGPLGIELKRIVFAEGRAIAQLGREVAHALPVEGLVDAAVDRVFLFGLDVEAGDEVGVLHLLSFFLNYQRVPGVLLLPNLQLEGVLRIHDVAQVLFLVLEFQSQYFFALAVVFLEVADFLAALGGEVHGDGFVEVGLGHFVESFLQLGHGLVEGGCFEFERLVFGLYFDLVEVLLEVEAFDGLPVHVPQL